MCIRDSIHQVAHDVTHAIYYRDGVSVTTLLEDGCVDRALSVHPHHAGKDLASVLSVRDIADPDDGRTNHLQRQPIDFLNAGELAVGVDTVIQGADGHVSGGQNQVGAIHGANHVHQAELVCLQLERIRVDHDLAITAPERLWNTRPRDARHLIANREL